MFDFIFHRDEKTAAIVEAKYQALRELCESLNSMSLVNWIELVRLAKKAATMKAAEKGAT